MKRWLKAFLPIALLLSVGAVIISGGLLSAKFILEPKSVAWLNDYLPEFLQIPLPEWDRPQTLAEIERQIQKSDQTIGEVVDLNTREKLIPIIRSGYNCISKCDRITELRIYRPAKANGPKRNEKHYRIVAQIGVGALEDWHIANALSVSETGSSNISGEPLPLETYETMESPVSGSGHWFNLTGKRNQGEYKVTYGQLFHYDSKSSTLTALVKWASPDEQQPIAWQQLTGSATPELMVNHTIGLEPSYQAYLADLKSTPDLRLISLTQAPIAGAESRSAINLMKVGLWGLAADRLKQVKNSGGSWNAMAQAQLDLVQYHARLTRDQAQQNFSSALQQVVAKLLDGRWKEAFTGLDKDPTAQQDIQESLKTETVRLWKRLSVALPEDPGDPYLQAWMAAVMLDRDGLSKTRSWLSAQGASSIRTQVLQVIAPAIAPRPPKPEPKPTPSLDPAAKDPSQAVTNQRDRAEEDRSADAVTPELPGNPRLKTSPTPTPMPMPVTF